MTYERIAASELSTDLAIVNEKTDDYFPVKDVKDADDPDMLYVDLELPSGAVHTYSYGKKAQVAVKDL